MVSSFGVLQPQWNQIISCLANGQKREVCLYYKVNFLLFSPLFLQVLTFILFICACTAVSNVSPFLNPLIAGNLGRDTSAAGGWLVFVTLITLIIEGLLLAGRFLVFGFAVTYATIVHIVVSHFIVLKFVKQDII